MEKKFFAGHYAWKNSGAHGKQGTTWHQPKSKAGWGDSRGIKKEEEGFVVTSPWHHLTLISRIAKTPDL